MLAVSQVAQGVQPLRIGFAWGALDEDAVRLLRTWRHRSPRQQDPGDRRADPKATLRRGEIGAAVLRTAPDLGAGFSKFGSSAANSAWGLLARGRT
jgi:hypothetical protein